jgi:hypothetical protein
LIDLVFGDQQEGMLVAVGKDCFASDLTTIINELRFRQLET